MSLGAAPLPVAHSGDCLEQTPAVFSKMSSFKSHETCRMFAFKLLPNRSTGTSVTGGTARM